MSKHVNTIPEQFGLLIIFLVGIWVSPVHAQNDEPVLIAQPSQVLLDKLGEHPFSVAVGDVNGDGALDIITANISADVTVLAGDGDGGSKRRYRKFKRPIS